MKNNLILGIDLGNCIVGDRKTNNKKYVDPDCFRVIAELVKTYKDVYIISRVNSAQRDRSLDWLKESDFFNKTGVNPDNLYYCWERRDKSVFVKAFDIDVFIDDRCGVMEYLPQNVVKLLINPEESDLKENEHKLTNYEIVKSWKEIEEKLLLCQGCSKEKGEDFHTCPYKEEINNDYKSLCNCCENCCHECAIDI